jgi:hypothetical protein
MDNLYKPTPVGKIQSWRKDIADFGGEPDVYKTLNLHLDSAASADFQLPIPIRNIKGLRVEEVHITADQPTPYVYIHSHALNSLLSYNSNVMPSHAWDAVGSDVMVAQYGSNSIIGVFSTQHALYNTQHFASYVNSSPEFLPCRGGDLMDRVDLHFMTGSTDVDNVVSIFLKIGFMCRDQLRS